MTGQHHASPGSGHTNPTGQQLGLNSSIGRTIAGHLLVWLLEMKIKNTAIERLSWLAVKPLVQTASLFPRVNGGGTSCWGWSPGPRFEKSTTELKLKQKLLKCKSTIQIATFNVRTLNRIGQLPELTASAIDNNIYIICIQELRYIQSKDIKYHDTVNWWMFASAWKISVNTAIGVNMLIGLRSLKSLKSIEKIQPRMMVAMFNGNPSATIISCNKPTNVNEETDLTAFYNRLSFLVHSILKHNILVIGGDMNTQIGKNVNHKFSWDNLSNRNGENLTDFMLENRLTWLNTKYQKRKTMDLILMSRVFANSQGDRGSIPDRVIPKTQKMILDAALLNTAL